jgi:hypothetical protein
MNQRVSLLTWQAMRFQYCLLGPRSQRRSEKVLTPIAPHDSAGAKPSYIHRGLSSVHVLRVKETRWQNWRGSKMVDEL